MDIVKEAAAFRDAVRRAGRRGPGRRYPADLRRRGAEYLRARQAAGAPLSAILRELGMGRETLAGWAAPAEPEARPRFVPVTVMCVFRPSRSAIPADADHPYRQGDHPGRNAAG